MESKIYHLTEKEVHMVGEYVGIVWNIKYQRDPRNPDMDMRLKSGKPYIDFLNLQEHEGRFYENDDGPIDGGISVVQAEQLLEELKRAIDYYKTVAMFI